MPKRVTAIGGIFFKCQDPAAVREWYNKHLGFNTDQYGTPLSGDMLMSRRKKATAYGAPLPKTPITLSPPAKTLLSTSALRTLIGFLLS